MLARARKPHVSAGLNALVAETSCGGAGERCSSRARTPPHANVHHSAGAGSASARAGPLAASGSTCERTTESCAMLVCASDGAARTIGRHGADSAFADTTVRGGAFDALGFCTCAPSDRGACCRGFAPRVALGTAGLSVAGSPAAAASAVRPGAGDFVRATAPSS